MTFPDMRSRPKNRHRPALVGLWSGRRPTYLGIVGVTIVSVVLVLLSPLALELLDRTSGVDWMQLSNIGQTYGAVSAVLTVFAVGGVALSLILQVREVRVARAQTWLTFHQSLMERATDDPLYLSCWGPFPTASLTEKKQNLYVNLMISFWQMLYDNDQIEERQLRYFAAVDLFGGEAGRRFWSATRGFSASYVQPNRDQRFD